MPRAVTRQMLLAGGLRAAYMRPYRAKEGERYLRISTEGSRPLPTDISFFPFSGRAALLHAFSRLILQNLLRKMLGEKLHKGAESEGTEQRAQTNQVAQ